MADQVRTRNLSTGFWIIFTIFFLVIGVFIGYLFNSEISAADRTPLNMATNLFMMLVMATMIMPTESRFHSICFGVGIIAGVLAVNFPEVRFGAMSFWPAIVICLIFINILIYGIAKILRSWIDKFYSV